MGTVRAARALPALLSIAEVTAPDESRLLRPLAPAETPKPLQVPGGAQRADQLADGAVLAVGPDRASPDDHDARPSPTTPSQPSAASALSVQDHRRAGQRQVLVGRAQ